jgi:hypothetical protein
MFEGFFVKEEMRVENQEVLDEKDIRRFDFSLDYPGNGFRHPI